MIIAIQQDNYGSNDASSPIWVRLLNKAGFVVREVDVYRADILDQLKGCQGFMWRFGHHPQMRLIANRLLPVIERELGLLVYPDHNTCWHYDDKLAQAYLFLATEIPTPKTWIWYKRELALEWAQTAKYPTVLKLWAGASSSNVRLVKSLTEAKIWIDRLFGNGVADLRQPLFSMRKTLLKVANVFQVRDLPHPWELHKGYVYFQEFLPGNVYDTRITVIGNRAFGFRRFNRENDFRASGSGKIDHNPREISTEFVRLAFEAARKLKTQSCAIDGLWRADQPVIGEISYTFASWAVQACPGHWDSDLNWHEGQLWPEEAQIQDFIERLKTSPT